MTGWKELLSSDEPASNGMFEGRVIDDAQSLGAQVRVVISFHDGEQTFGPAPWMPRVDVLGTPVFPNDGDRCMVAFAETDDPGEPEVWIAAWWPYD